MKKQFLNLGKALNSVEQKSINGGAKIMCSELDGICPYGYTCNSNGFCVIAPNEQ